MVIILTGAIIIFSLQNGWNLILVTSILSLLITVILFIAANGINKETSITIGKIYQSPCACSCYLCGNKRKNHGEKMQERRAKLLHTD